MKRGKSTNMKKFVETADGDTERANAEPRKKRVTDVEEWATPVRCSIRTSMK